MEVNEETGQATLTIRKCFLGDKGIYSCQILEFVKTGEVAYCDCIVDIQGKDFLKTDCKPMYNCILCFFMNVQLNI